MTEDELTAALITITSTHVILFLEWLDATLAGSSDYLAATRSSRDYLTVCVAAEKK
jgi:hypothetical protein